MRPHVLLIMIAAIGAAQLAQSGCGSDRARERDLKNIVAIVTARVESSPSEDTSQSSAGIIFRQEDRTSGASIYVVTARHGVVDEKDLAELESKCTNRVVGNSKKRIEVRLFADGLLIDKDGHLVYYCSEPDLAVLQVRLKAHELSKLDLNFAQAGDVSDIANEAGTPPLMIMGARQKYWTLRAATLNTIDRNETAQAELSIEARQIDVGFSGGPVLKGDTWGIIGMTTKVEGDRSVGKAESIDTIRRSLDEAGYPSQLSTPWSEHVTTGQVMLGAASVASLAVAGVFFGLSRVHDDRSEEIYLDIEQCRERLCASEQQERVEHGSELAASAKREQQVSFAAGGLSLALLAWLGLTLAF